MLNRRWSAIAVGILFLTSCAVGPEYLKPDIDMPGTYHKREAVSEDRNTGR